MKKLLLSLLLPLMFSNISCSPTDQAQYQYVPSTSALVTCDDVVAEVAGQSNASHQAKADFAMLRRTDIDEHVARLEQAALSGTSLALDWQPGSGTGLWEDLVGDLSAVADHLSFVIWIQGEKDANVYTRAIAYKDNLRQHVLSVQEASGFIGPWFVVYLNAEYNGGAYGAIVRTAQEELVAESQAGLGPAPYRIIGVNPDELTIENGLYDGIHYVYKDGRIALAFLYRDVVATYYGWDVADGGI